MYSNQILQKPDDLKYAKMGLQCINFPLMHSELQVKLNFSKFIVIQYVSIIKVIRIQEYRCLSFMPYHPYPLSEG